MSDIPTFSLRCLGAIAGDRIVLGMRSDHDCTTLVLSAEMAAQLRDDLITACQVLGNFPPLTITQRHNPDGSITVLYGWRREDGTP